MAQSREERIAKLLDGIEEKLLGKRKAKAKPGAKSALTKPAEVLQWPKPLSQVELARRQAIIDATWERVIAERQALEAEWARTCHRGPGDPDWPA